MKNIFLNEDRVIVRSLLKKLSFKQRRAIILRFWYRQSISDVARTLRITWDETDKIITKALSTLKTECMAQPRFSNAYNSKGKIEGVTNSDIFKGHVDKEGRVKKVHSVGQACYEETSGFSEIHLDGERMTHILEPNPDVNMAHDYVIYCENLEKKTRNSVGVGYLLHSPNAGLINLKWDSGISDIYIDLSLNEAQESVELAA